MTKTFLYTLTVLLSIGFIPQAFAQENADQPDRSGVFETLDSDADGRISRDEFMKKKLEHKREKRSKMLQEIDSNDDGIISEDEFISKSRERFSKLDADGDGRVTKEEAQQHRQAKKEQRREKRQIHRTDTTE